MLQEAEAQDLITKFIELREKANETKNDQDIAAFRKQEKLCIEKFQYLVSMKSARYKKFSNYEDLNQEGFEALIKAMKNYNPKKGNAFWWFHRYIDTRISRSANLHTAIRYPLKVAKDTAPKKEAVIPTLIEERFCPDLELETHEVNSAIQETISLLSPNQKEIIDLAYGFSGNKPMSINKICKKLNISRSNCIKSINSSLEIMRENIKL